MNAVRICLVLVATALALLAGCKSACDSATDRIVARYKECGVPVTTSGTGASGDVACESGDATYLDCRADCIESATCEAIKVEDPQGAADLAQCNVDCN